MRSDSPLAQSTFRECAESEVEGFLRGGVVPFLQEHGFTYESAVELPRVFETLGTEYLLGCLQDGKEQSPEAFMKYFEGDRPRLEVLLFSQQPRGVPYLSEVASAQRLAEDSLLTDQGRINMLYFSLRLEREAHQAVIPWSVFLGRLAEARNKGFQDLEDEDVQFLRQGAVRYFNQIFALEPLEGDHELDDDLRTDIQVYFYDFVDYFSVPEHKSDFLDFKLRQNLKETLWFLEALEFDEGTITEFATTAQGLAMSAIHEQKRGHVAKHYEFAAETQRASPLEHYLAVTRLTLGHIDSLIKNTCIFPQGFVEDLKSRPDFMLEAAYTALFHDILEDKKKTEYEIRYILGKAGLPPELVDRILENLRLLNGKRAGPDGNEISIEAYSQAILASGNPVVLLVKYADIIHNNKSLNPSKYEDGQKTLTDKWQRKQRAYDPIIGAVLDLPGHIRIEEPRRIFSVNPELAQWPNFRRLLVEHPQKETVLAGIAQSAKQKVTALLAA